MLDKTLYKRSNESELDYMKRIIYGKLVDKTINNDWEELSELIFGEGNCYNSSEVRKRAYGIKTVLDILENYKAQKEDNESVLEELENKKIEIQKERYRLNDIRTSFNREIKEQSRWDDLISKINDKIDNIVKYQQEEQNAINEPKIDLKSNAEDIDVIDSTIIKDGVLLLGDFHYGKKFEIFGLNGNIINEYSTNIFQQRMWEIARKTLQKCEKENLTSIKVCILGDLIEGALRVSAYRLLQMGVIDQTIECANFLIRWLTYLCKYVKIHYIQVSGNHDEIRLNGMKASETPEENIGKIVFEIVIKSLASNPNFSYEKLYDSNICLFKVAKYFDCVAVHSIRGDSYNAIKDYENIYNQNIDYIFCGHQHFSNSKTVAINKEVIGAPSIVGSDDYSMKLKKSANSGALFLVFDEEYGKSITYDIKIN